MDEVDGVCINKFPIRQKDNMLKMKDLKKGMLYFGMTLFSLSPFVVSAKTIMVLGDSISAGYRMNPEQGWVSLLQNKLNQKILYIIKVKGEEKPTFQLLKLINNFLIKELVIKNKE